MTKIRKEFRIVTRQIDIFYFFNRANDVNIDKMIFLLLREVNIENKLLFL